MPVMPTRLSRKDKFLFIVFPIAVLLYPFVEPVNSKKKKDK